MPPPSRVGSASHTPVSDDAEGDDVSDETINVPRGWFLELLDLADDTVHYAADGWDWKYNFSGRFESVCRALLAAGVELPEGFARAFPSASVVDSADTPAGDTTDNGEGEQ